MPDAFKKLYQGRPGDTATTLYTVAVSTSAIVKNIVIVNPATGSNYTMKLWHDGTADTNLILPAVTVMSGGWGNFDGVILMEASDTMSGQASVSGSLTVTIYGDEVTV